MNCRQAYCATHGVCGIRERVHPSLRRWRIRHDLVYAVGQSDATQRNVSGGDALREGEDIGLDAVAFETEPAARSAKAGDDLVSNEEHVVLVADFPDAGEVVIGRNNESAGTLYGFCNKRRNSLWAFLKNRLLQQVRSRHARTYSRLSRDKSVRIGRLDMKEARQLTAEHGPEYRKPRCAHCRHRHAVVRKIAADDFGLLRFSLRDPEEAGRLD